MQNFKTEYSRYRDNKRSKEYQARKKGADHQSFKENHKKSVKESESRKKAEDLKAFKENHKKRVKESEARKKAQNPQDFNKNTRERKLKSDNNVSASKRLINFRRKTKFGPIFICSSCHQKLFENQVEEITDEIRANIDDADPGIRLKCIEEEIKVD